MKKKSSAFRSRLFFSYSALIVLSVGVFLTVLYMTIAQTGETEARASQKEAALGLIRQLESQLRELDTLAAQTMTNAQLISYFVPLKSDADDENYFDDNVLEFIDASSLLATLNAANNTAARVSAYNLGGDYVSAGTLYETKARIRETLSDKASIGAQLTRLSASGQRRLILPPGQDPFSSSGKSRLFQILRPLSSAYVSEIYGIVSVQQDVSALERLGLSYERDSGVCLLMTDEGEVILPEVPGELGLAACAAALSMQRPDIGAVVSADLDGLFVSVARMDLSGWLLVTAQPKAQLLSAYRSTLTMLLAFGLLLIAVLLGVVYFMADRITRPLSRLSESIERVTLSNMALPEPEQAYASVELIALDRAFRTMLGRLNDSIGLEMRAYLYALQSQMNPHFLYNILSVICATGEEEGSTKTVDMCLKLSAMLRYIAAYEQTEAVTLRDEIEHTERYLQLMKVRYEDKFNYSIRVDPDAEDMRVPKLILQPLAENCFKHGFLSVRPPWSIRITVQMQGERFLITVADNGTGMSDQTIEDVTGRIEASLSDLAGHYQELSIGGMGLINTVLRLKLLMGGETSYFIQRGPDGGTIIQIGGRCA